MTCKKRILFVGCSHTANSGFLPENQQKFHWPWLLSSYYDCFFQNSGIGGSSNEEIFFRCSEIVLTQRFDLVVVMWSNIGRKWVYFEDHNVDDYSIINQGSSVFFGGLNSDSNALKQYAKIHYTYFNNRFIDIKKWLLQTINLATLLQRQNTPFVFIKGFDNFVTEILNSNYQNLNTDLTPELKKILDFDNRPDFYIIEKLNSLKVLAQTANKPYWFNFDKHAFTSKHYQIDLSDDGKHLGRNANQKLFSELVEYFQSIRLVF